MRKFLETNEKEIKITEQRNRFLALGVSEKVYTVPVHLISMVQKAYNGNGTISVTVFLESNEEILFAYNEVDNIEEIFSQFLSLKEQVRTFRIEVYNVDTQETFDK